MVLGIERINARVKQPNDRINFIKPLKGPSEKYAQDFLERIAAICNPIMKKHHLVVMALEEYAYNTEFLGRNFNGGEVIQLVLKSKSGSWLPFRFVQMVMMHELAHNVQMNHSAAFWKVKNMYSEELKELWARNYTGEGLWSRGRTLYTGEYDGELKADEVLPEHLCGGTYRSSGKRKRTVKPRLSSKEQKERRIRKKFGVDGKTLGADDAVKSELEGGKKAAGKPRVAQSQRGRELRAAAALARLDTNKEEPVKDENDITTDSGSETDGEWDPTIKTEPGEAHDVDGTKLHDLKGGTMVKICDDEDEGDNNVKNEMDELSELRNIPGDGSDTESEDDETAPKTRRKSVMMDFGPDCEPKSDDEARDDEDDAGPKAQSKPVSKPKAEAPRPKRRLVQGSKIASKPRAEVKEVAVNPPFNVSDPPSRASATKSAPRRAASPPPVLTCPACSVDNDLDAATCVVCSNVLDVERVDGTWKCESEVCRGGQFINAGDYGVCAVCGGSAPGRT